MSAVTKAGEVGGELLVLLEHEVAQHAVEAQRRPDRLDRASHTSQHALYLCELPFGTHTLHCTSVYNSAECIRRGEVDNWNEILEDMEKPDTILVSCYLLHCYSIRKHTINRIARRATTFGIETTEMRRTSGRRRGAAGKHVESNCATVSWRRKPSACRRSLR